MTKKLTNGIFLTLILGAAIIVLKVFAQNHSLFLDELNLARNIIELNYLDYFKPLNYQQFSPPLFLCLEKIVIDILGVSDYSLRLIPLIFTLASFILFARIVLSTTQSVWAQLFAIVLFLYSSQVIYHAVEVKQYAADLFIATFLLYTVLILKWNPKSDLVKLCLTGIVSIWISMPSVFVLSGMGLYLLYNDKEKAKSSSLIMILTWIASFWLFYGMILEPALSNDGLVTFHSPYYFGKNENIIEQIKGLFSTFLDKTAIPIIGGIILFILGSHDLYKKQKGILILLILPIISMLFASFIGQYSIIPRLILFTFPFWILIIAYGLSSVLSLPKQFLILKIPLLTVSFLLLITTLVNNSSLQYITNKMEKEEGRSVLLEIPSNNNLPIYLTHHAIPTYEYYCILKDNPIVLSGNIIKGTFNQDLSALNKTLLDNEIDSLWILDIHTFGEEKKLLDIQISEIGKVVQKIDKKYASAILVKLSGS